MCRLEGWLSSTLWNSVNIHKPFSLVSVAIAAIYFAAILIATQLGNSYFLLMNVFSSLLLSLSQVENDRQYLGYGTLSIKTSLHTEAYACISNLAMPSLISC